MRSLWLALLIPACVDTSTDRVKLTGRVPTATLEVQGALLVTQLSGELELELERGDLSESAATVTEPPVVSVLGATGAELLVLDALPSPALPWSVAPDTSLAVSYRLTDRNVVDEATATTLCEGGATIRLLVQPDDADALTVDSAPLAPSGCD